MKHGTSMEAIPTRLVLSLVVALISSSTMLWVGAPTYANSPQAEAKVVHVRMVTEVGDIVVEIYENMAPRTARHFLRYVDEGYYNGGTFFRTARSANNQPKDMVKIDVIQGGPHAWKIRIAAYPPIMLEPTSETGVKHVDGAISLARTAPDSPNDHFFICIGDQPDLDAGGKRHKDGMGFPAFGKVVEGMEVVKRVHAMKAEGQGIISPVRILSMTRE